MKIPTHPAFAFLAAAHLLAPIAPAAPGAGLQEGHQGAPVAPAGSPARGAARFAGPLHDAFDLSQALADTVFLDGFYRTPASPYYDSCLDRLADRLRRAGFREAGAEPADPDGAPGLTLRVIETETRGPAWWPLAASLELEDEEGTRELLLAFASPGDAHRAMLPQGAPAADVRGPIALELEQVAEGSILVTRSPLSTRLVGEVRTRGGIAILSAGLFPFTRDPSGGDRHLDAIQFGKAPRSARGGPRRGGGADLAPVAVGKISPRVMARIQEAAPGATLRFHAKVAEEERPLRTLMAVVVGSGRPDEAVAIASHLQELGAGDNAAGAAGMCAAACTLARGIAAGTMERPDRSLAFVFGDEMGQSRIWLDQGGRTTVAALSADMLGQSPERTGAVALLERTPDPGALYTIPPDAHTPWGAGRVREGDLVPSGVNVVCREALRDVAKHVGGWRTSENPWEGGSDHDVFNRAGIPAALMWHFTDFTYHTSLDRMEMIDGNELRRTCAAIASAGLALADMGPSDVERHLESNELERQLRKDAAEAAGKPEASEAWDAWCDGAAAWLRSHGAR